MRLKNVPSAGACRGARPGLGGATRLSVLNQASFHLGLGYLRGGLSRGAPGSDLPQYQSTKSLYTSKITLHLCTVQLLDAYLRGGRVERRVRVFERHRLQAQLQPEPRACREGERVCVCVIEREREREASAPAAAAVAGQ